MIDTRHLPESPGCYLFRNEKGEILYIGKARNIRKRVSSYFQKKDHEVRIQNMVNQASLVDFIVTGSEVEAFILENNLIKTHQPKYNIDLRDAKSYAYIHMTDELYPRIGIARQQTEKGSFYGPFTSAAERDRVLRLGKKLFRLRSCKTMKKRPCLRFHLGSCSGPCQGNQTPADYQRQVKNCDLFLRGKMNELIGDLKTVMKEKSAACMFEEALAIRDQVRAIEHLSQRQYVQRRPVCDEDYIHYACADDTVFLSVFSIQKGKLMEKQDFSFPSHPDFFEEFIIQYYADEQPPRELVIPIPVSASIGEYLSVRLGKKVTVTMPKAGEKLHLLQMVLHNIEASHMGGRMKVNALQNVLALRTPPSRIECFDISHTGGTAVVASMVFFRDGKPDKSGYRRFKIRSVQGIDDFAAMGEVVHRRYARLVREGRPLPDLILLDGGRGQLNAALSVLDKLSLDIQVAAIAKREEEIYLPGWPTPMKIPRDDRGLLYLREIRDEAHRFAITYHRLLRRKELTKA